MNTEEIKDQQETAQTEETVNQPAEETTAAENETVESQEEEKKELTPEEKIAELEKELEEAKKKYIYLMADFENYRKKVLAEKQDLLKYGASESLKKLLPVIDDFERAIDANEKTEAIDVVKEGFKMIYSKFQTYLEQNNLTVIPAAAGDDFNVDIHEAMTMFPAPTPELKGKIVDCVTKGYKLNDKVIRYAKVVVGQ